MPAGEPLWGPPATDEAVAALVDLADDWTDVGALLGEIGRRCGRDITPPDAAVALGELAGVLIDHGVVPGDLDVDPDFRPWPGTRQERVDRVVQEVLALRRMPWPGEIAWFYRSTAHVR